jgi:hypothetical protein
MGNRFPWLSVGSWAIAAKSRHARECHPPLARGQTSVLVLCRVTYRRTAFRSPYAKSPPFGVALEE